MTLAAGKRLGPYEIIAPLKRRPTYATAPDVHHGDDRSG
jgi:hypothetical protein